MIMLRVKYVSSSHNHTQTCRNDLLRFNINKRFMPENFTFKVLGDATVAASKLLPVI